MSKRIPSLVLACVVATALFAGAGITAAGRAGAQEPAPTATPVTTGNIKLVAISPAICLMLVGARPGQSTNALGCLSLDDELSPMKIADIVGDGDGIVEASDFAGVDLDGNQVHQQDNWDLFNQAQSASGSLFILAFVPNHAPVTFRTNSGVFVPRGSANPPDTGGTNVDAVGQVYTCDTTTGTLSGVEDQDCDPSSTTGDGVVVARLRARFGANIAPIGPGTVTVTQAATDQGTIGFRVVGEPRVLSFTTLESTIQDGVTLPSLAATPTAGGAATATPTADEKAKTCPLPGDAAGFLGANGTPERTIVLGIAKDIEGNAITGAIVNWKTDDRNKGIMAAPLTPTLDLGSFGFGAPNILCGTVNTGTVTVTGTVSADIVTPGLTITGADPGANLGTAQNPIFATLTKTFTVVGPPSTITLAPDPATLPCDGVASSSLTATVLDAAGNPVASGNQVTFSVQTLGTANPIVGKTDDKGVTKSAITPLSSDAAGVPVAVSTGNVAVSALIGCVLGAAAGPTAPPPGGGPGGSGSGPTGITLPDTGTGQGSSAADWTWLYAGAAATFLLVTLGGVAWRKRTQRR